jgi:hypothetical protein
MGRTKLAHRLPSLPRALGLPRGANPKDWLLRILRRVAMAGRDAQPKSFYPLRDISEHFHVPLSSVARTYRELEKEGFLSRIRGSGTVLQGAAPMRRLTVRSIVGIPACLSCLVTLQDYRVFLMKACGELRRRGLITPVVFYENRVDAEGIAEKIQEARADVILWYRPDRAAKVAALQLQDLGIRVLGISDGGLPSLSCRYNVQRESAIRAILRDWMASGVKNVRILRDEWRSSADEERIEAILSETALQWRFIASSFNSTKRFLTQLSVQEDKAIILLAPAATFFAARAPEAFNKMLSSCRVALFDGPISMPLTRLTDAPVDVIVVDWGAVAERIAKDILSSHAFASREPVVFEATARLRTALSKFAQKI